MVLDTYSGDIKRTYIIKYYVHLCIRVRKSYSTYPKFVNVCIYCMEYPHQSCTLVLFVGTLPQY